MHQLLFLFGVVVVSLQSTSSSFLDSNVKDGFSSREKSRRR
jgi:hypothetical protein